ncbi:MAG: phage holin family protein [Anaerolineae bacterium]
MYTQKQDMSLGELFSQLSRDVSRLVQAEVKLAKTEMTEKASKARNDIGAIVFGGLLAYAGLLAVLAAIIVGLAMFIPLWLSALIVGLVVIGIGVLLIKQGSDRLKQQSMAPEQTIQSLKENVEWAKQQAT